MHRKYNEVTHTTSTIRRLEQDLEQARETILDLLPEPKRRVLRSYFDCETRSDADCWTARVVEELTELADVLPSNPVFLEHDRAYCPLCGAGNSGPYEDGFALPEGLRRHIVGWGNMRRCPVFEAAYRLAQDAWDRKFKEGEESAEEERQARISQRMQSETLYAVTPGEEAVLIDDRGYEWRPARDEVGLRWAEQRLSDLGFRIHVNGRVKSYIYEEDDLVVYADPRTLGELSFRVFKRPIPERSRIGRRKHHDATRPFSIPDRWKHNLLDKFKANLAAVTR